MEKQKNLKEYAKPLFSKFKDLDLNKIKYAATLDFGKINTNWKFLIENFIEPYHVQFVHKTTTNQPLKDHYTIVDGICYGSGVNVNKEDNKNNNALSVSSKYLSLFPNFIIGTYYPNQIGVYLNVPIGPSITSQKRIIYTTDGKNLCLKKRLILQKRYGGMYIKKITKCVKDCKKEDHPQRQMMVDYYLLTGKKELENFKN